MSGLLVIAGLGIGVFVLTRAGAPAGSTSAARCPEPPPKIDYVPDFVESGADVLGAAGSIIGGAFGGPAGAAAVSGGARGGASVTKQVALEAQAAGDAARAQAIANCYGHPVGTAYSTWDPVQKKLRHWETVSGPPDCCARELDAREAAARGLRSFVVDMNDQIDKALERESAGGVVPCVDGFRGDTPTLSMAEWNQGVAQYRALRNIERSFNRDAGSTRLRKTLIDRAPCDADVSVLL